MEGSVVEAFHKAVLTEHELVSGYSDLPLLVHEVLDARQYSQLAVFGLHHTNSQFSTKWDELLDEDFVIILKGLGDGRSYFLLRLAQAHSNRIAFDARLYDEGKLHCWRQILTFGDHLACSHWNSSVCEDITTSGLVLHEGLRSHTRT